MSLPPSTPRMPRPDREVLSARVTYSGPGWLDVEPDHAPRTPLTFLERHAVFLEYVDPAGLVRLRGPRQPVARLAALRHADAALHPRARTSSSCAPASTRAASCTRGSTS